MTPIVNEPEQFEVTVRNIGALDLNSGDYQVNLMQVVEDGDDIVLQSLNGQAIEHLEEQLYTFNYTFDASGEYDIYAVVAFSPDICITSYNVCYTKLLRRAVCRSMVWT